MHNLLEQYADLLKTIDSWFLQAQQYFPQAIRCQSGCSGCCRGLFDITLLDAALVASGYRQLDDGQRGTIHRKAVERLGGLQRRWPGFSAPYLLNGLPDAEWTEMPEEDETPCPFLGDNGLCLVYAFRPMTCRLHGLPNLDLSGESFSDRFCTLNFQEIDPLNLPQLKWAFRRTFLQELELFQAFTKQLTGTATNELDTFLPLVPLIDFDQTDWQTLSLYRLPQPAEKQP